MPLLVDWDEFQDGFGVISIDHFTASPVVGARSVRLTIPFHSGGAGQSSRAAIMLKEPPHDRDFTLGVVRTLVHALTIPRRYGIFCMAQSAVNPCLIGSACYTLAAGVVGSTFHITRLPDLSSTGPIDFVDTGVPALLIGETIPLELKWKASLTIFGGVQLEARFGNLGDTDFTNLDLATPTIVTDSTGGALFTSNGEGVFASNIDQTQAHQILYDDTSVFETVIIP